VSALVLALTGTDHHPFDRLVQWMDVAAGLRDDVRFVVQHGYSSAPQVAEGHSFLPHDHMVELMRQAAVVVCHGGPGTIMDARLAGHVPLCLPRDPGLGEHVDGHQQRFAAVVGEVGLVRVVPSLEALVADVDGGLVQGPRGPRTTAADTARQEALALVSRELDQVVSLRVPRPRRYRSSPIGAR
jgi:UDP-N-acetylglucosamine transferase subunit ALG13